jgi:hypothetical protein
MVSQVTESMTAPLASVQTGTGPFPVTYTLRTRDPFPKGKVRPGRDADYSLTSRVEAKKE